MHELLEVTCEATYARTEDAIRPGRLFVADPDHEHRAG